MYTAGQVVTNTILIAHTQRVLIRMKLWECEKKCMNISFLVLGNVLAEK